MKPEQKRKSLAILAMMFGVYWLWVGRGFLAMEPLEGDFLPWSAAVIFMVTAYLAIFAIVGVTAVFSGIELFRKPSAAAAKRIIILVAIFTGLFVAGLLMEWKRTLSDDSIASSAMVFVTALFAVTTYPVIARRVLMQLGIEFTEKSTPRVGRGGLIVLAWTLWLLLSSVAEVTLSSVRGITSLLALFVPIAISYGAYRYAVKKLGLTRPRKHLYAFERQGIKPIYPPGAKPE